MRYADALLKDIRRLTGDDDANIVIKKDSEFLGLIWELGWTKDNKSYSFIKGIHMRELIDLTSGPVQDPDYVCCMIFYDAFTACLKEMNYGTDQGPKTSEGTPLLGG